MDSVLAMNLPTNILGTPSQSRGAGLSNSPQQAFTTLGVAFDADGMGALGSGYKMQGVKAPSSPAHKSKTLTANPRRKNIGTKAQTVQNGSAETNATSTNSKKVKEEKAQSIENRSEETGHVSFKGIERAKEFATREASRAITMRGLLAPAELRGAASGLVIFALVISLCLNHVWLGSVVASGTRVGWDGFHKQGDDGKLGKNGSEERAGRHIQGVTNDHFCINKGQH